MTLPRISLQLADVNYQGRKHFGSSIWAIVDSGSTLNLLSSNSVPPNTKLTPTEVSFRGVNNTTTPSKGCCKFFIRPINPHNGQPLGESQKPILFHVSEQLPDMAIIGIPVLRDAQINFPDKQVTLTLGKRPWIVPFCTASTFVTSAFQRNNSHNEYELRHNAKQIESSLSSDFDISAVRIAEKLPRVVRSRIIKLLGEFRHCFQKHEDEVSYFRNGDHPPLRLTTSSNVYTQPKAYPIPKALHPAFTKQLETWLRQGVVVPQDRVVEFRGNFVPVKKKDGTYRFTYDSRNLNSILNNENAVIPPIQEILAKSAGHRFYTTLDISNYFLLFKLDRESSDMLTFADPVTKRLYRFQRTMFGVKSVMSNAILLLSHELNRLPDRAEWLSDYVDDLTLYHDDLDQHITDLKRLLSVLSDANIKLKPSKIRIAFSECNIFGYILNKHGFTIAPDRKNDILKIPKPNSRKQLMSFLGKASYFRNIIDPEYGMGYFNYHFRDLTSESRRFKWLPRHDVIWEKLKQSFRRHITLQTVKPSDDHMVVRTDASQSNMGATLSALRHGEEVLINTMSKCWTAAVNNYHITRLELIGALLALAAFKGDLIGRKVDLYVDNASTYFTLKNPHRVDVYGTLLPRLFYDIRLIEFQVYKTDNKDVNWALVDALSRSPGRIVVRARNVNELLEVTDEPEPEHCVKIAHLAPVTTVLKGLQIHAPLHSLKVFRDMVDKMTTYMDPKTKEVKPEFREQLITAAHNLGHLGVIPTTSLLASYGLNWNYRNADVKTRVAQCEACGVFKHKPGPINIRQAEVMIPEPKYSLAIDVAQVGQPAVLNFLVAIDLYTDFGLAIRIHGPVTSTSVTKALLVILARYAPSCHILRMDNASYFTSTEFKDFLKNIGVKQWFTTRLNSRANGKAERFIRSIKEQLRFMNLRSFSGPDWDSALELAVLIINLKPKYNGITPYTLTYGTIEPKNANKLPQINTDGLSEYQKAITDRIQALRGILSLHFDNPVPSGVATLYPEGSLVRIKASATRNFNSLTLPKYTDKLFKIIEIKHETQS